MNVREKHAAQLLEAAQEISSLDHSFPLPEANILPALKRTEAVWRESENYALPALRRELRLSVISLRGLMQSLEKADVLSDSDVTRLREIEVALRGVAGAMTAQVRRDVTEVVETRPTFSAIGMRMTSFSELADAKPFVVAHHDMHATAALPVESSESERRLLQLDALKSKLPTKVRVGSRFETAKMPIAFIPRRLDRAALDRSGIKHFNVPGGWLPRDANMAPVSDTPIVVVEDQLVIGMDHRDAVNPEFLKSVVSQVSKRMGEHTNPLVAAGGKGGLLRSPGSSLSWMWLLSSHVVASGAVNPLSAQFPWKVAEAPEVKNRRIELLKKELKALTDQKATIDRLNLKQSKMKQMSLSPEDAKRLEELKTELEGEGGTPTKVESIQERTERLAALRRALEERVAKQFQRLIVEITETEAEIEELGPVDKEDQKTNARRAALKRNLNAMKQRLAEGRDQIARQLGRK